jgi:hypothetical protein
MKENMHTIEEFEDAINRLGYRKLEIDRMECEKGGVRFAYGTSGRIRIVWTSDGKAHRRNDKTPIKNYDLKFEVNETEQ